MPFIRSLLKKSANSGWGTTYLSAMRDDAVYKTPVAALCSSRFLLRRRETGGPFRKDALGVECAGRLSSTDCHRSKLLAGRPRRADKTRRFASEREAGELRSYNRITHWTGDAALDGSPRLVYNFLIIKPKGSLIYKYTNSGRKWANKSQKLGAANLPSSLLYLICQQIILTYPNFCINNFLSIRNSRLISRQL